SIIRASRLFLVLKSLHPESRSRSRIERFLVRLQRCRGSQPTQFRLQPEPEKAARYRIQSCVPSRYTTPGHRRTRDTRKSDDAHPSFRLYMSSHRALRAPSQSRTDRLGSYAIRLSVANREANSSLKDGWSQ